MRRARSHLLLAAALAGSVSAAAIAHAADAGDAQGDRSAAAGEGPNKAAGGNQTPRKVELDPEALIKTPVSGLHPGGSPPPPGGGNPVAGDPGAATRGMRYFEAFNCVGCHAPNGGGGMGPALSNRFFQYGSAPEQVYLSIVQGRPNGMPAWGRALPPEVVWDLVAYIEQISKAPDKQWGTTISAKSPEIEQVPAEYGNTVEPWSHTQPFGHGQNPEGRK